MCKFFIIGMIVQYRLVPVSCETFLTVISNFQHQSPLIIINPHLTKRTICIFLDILAIGCMCVVWQSVRVLGAYQYLGIINLPDDLVRICGNMPILGYCAA